MNDFEDQKERLSLPFVPSILRGKKKILRVRNSEQANSFNLSQRFTQEKQNKNHKRGFHSSFETTNDDENLKTRTSLNNRFSFPSKFQSGANQNSFYQESQRKRKTMNQEEIRERIDEKLNHIYQMLSERRLSFGLENRKINSSLELKGPKIGREMVSNYIQLLEKEYKVPKLKQKFYSNQKQYAQRLKMLKTQPLSEINSSPKVVKSDRKAFQLKKIFISSMKSSSIVNKKPNNNFPPKGNGVWR